MLRIALCGDMDFCMSIVKKRLEEKAYGGGYSVTCYIANDAEELAAEHSGEPLPVVDFYEAKHLIASGGLDAIVIAMNRIPRYETRRWVMRCKLNGLKVGLAYDPKNCDVYWPDPARNAMPYLETHLTDACNLNCAYCTHFAPLFAGNVPYGLAKFKRDLRRVAEHFEVAVLRLLGGEPLLVGNLGEYADAARAVFPKALIRLVTNGLLVPGISGKALDSLRSNGIVVDISAYPPTRLMAERISAVLDAGGVAHHLMKDIDRFFAMLTPEAAHDPERSHRVCSSDGCWLLREGRIYKCPPDALSFKFNERFGETFPPSAGVDIYADNFVELVQQLDNEIELCRYCSECPQLKPWRVAADPQPGDWLVDDQPQQGDTTPMITYRNATFADVEPIYALINDYARQGLMLARSRNALYESLRDMMLALDGDALVGIAGLHIVWDGLAEVRSVAIAPAHKRRSIGGELVRRLIEAAQPFGIEKVFTLTYQREFFRSLGFAEITKEDLPPKVWKDCIDCPKFPNCDEIAMIRPMNPEGGVRE